MAEWNDKLKDQLLNTLYKGNRVQKSTVPSTAEQPIYVYDMTTGQRTKIPEGMSVSTWRKQNPGVKQAISSYNLIATPVSPTYQYSQGADNIETSNDKYARKHNGPIIDHGDYETRSNWNGVLYDDQTPSLEQARADVEQKLIRRNMESTKDLVAEAPELDWDPTVTQAGDELGQRLADDARNLAIDQEYLDNYNEARDLGLQSRDLGLESREGQVFARDLLKQYAEGDKSVVQDQARIEREQLKNAVASQLASADRYDPAVNRGAYRALGENLANIATQAQVNAAKERQEAINALFGANTTMREGDEIMRSGDAKLQGLDQEAINSARNFETNKQQLAQSGYGVGFDKSVLDINNASRDIATDLQDYENRRTYKADRFGIAPLIDDRASGKQASQEQLNQQKKQATLDAWLKPLDFAAKAAPGIVAASDENCKTNITPANDKLSAILDGMFDTTIDRRLNTLRSNDKAKEQLIQANKARYLQALLGGGANVGRTIASMVGGIAKANAMPTTPTLYNPSTPYYFKSDENAKCNVNDADIKDFLNKMTAKEYDYKQPERDGYGRRIGVMAQDLQESKLGDEMVVDTDEGLAIKTTEDRFNPLVLASLAHLNERLNEIEKKKK